MKGSYTERLEVEEEENEEEKEEEKENENAEEDEENDDYVIQSISKDAGFDGNPETLNFSYEDEDNNTVEDDDSRLEALKISQKMVQEMEDEIGRIDKLLDYNREKHHIVKQLLNYTQALIEEEPRECLTDATNSETKGDLGEKSKKIKPPPPGDKIVHRYPWFQASDGSVPPPHPLKAEKDAVVKERSAKRPKRSWNEDERNRLCKAVEVMQKRTWINDIVEEAKQFKENVEREAASHNGPTAALVRKAKDFCDARLIKTLMTATPSSNTQYRQINWQALASEWFPGKRPGEPLTRTADDCMIQWMSTGENPHRKPGPWGEKDNRVLKEQAEHRKKRNWQEIARVVTRMTKTIRTPFECFKQFQKNIDKDCVRDRWKEKDDRKLKELVDKYGKKNMPKIAAMMTRTKRQCFARYDQRVKAGIEKGTWDKRRRLQLQLAHRTYGEKWSLIAEHVEGKTQVQVRERWCQHENPNVNKKKWTREEDLRLLSLMPETKKQGSIQWSQISSALGTGRTDYQVRMRFKRLEPDKFKDYTQLDKSKSSLDTSLKDRPVTGNRSDTRPPTSTQSDPNPKTQSDPNPNLLHADGIPTNSSCDFQEKKEGARERCIKSSLNTKKRCRDGQVQQSLSTRQRDSIHTSQHRAVCSTEERRLSKPVDTQVQNLINDKNSYSQIDLFVSTLVSNMRPETHQEDPRTKSTSRLKSSHSNKTPKDPNNLISRKFSTRPRNLGCDSTRKNQEKRATAANRTPDLVKPIQETQRDGGAQRGGIHTPSSPSRDSSHNRNVNGIPLQEPICATRVSVPTSCCSKKPSLRHSTTSIVKKGKMNGNIDVDTHIGKSNKLCEKYVEDLRALGIVIEEEEGEDNVTGSEMFANSR
mmetsp:Transcript_27601/g.67125  ORF Transcript_27601/g.67125 Transcript_27601/m.67125 type:complete len:872 (+) Transcript_27601:76-2691(+)